MIIKSNEIITDKEGYEAMDRLQLKKELDILGIASNQYSLTGSLNFDCIVLYENYNEWEVFYFNERGGRDSVKIFKSEDEACIYVYQLFEESKRIK